MKKQLYALTVLTVAGIGIPAAADPTTLATTTANFAVSNTSNGADSATARATANDGVGSSTATADLGALHDLAGVSGCGSTILFEQPCNYASAYASFTDSIQVLGASLGTPVSVEFDWTVSGTVNGTGAYSMQARFIEGNTPIEIDTDSDAVETFDNQSVGGSKSLIVNTTVGSVLGIAAFMNLGVSDIACAGGSQNCEISKTWSITADFSHTAALTGKILTPGVDAELIGADGHNYGPSLASVPEPVITWLLGAGLLGVAGMSRKTR